MDEDEAVRLDSSLLVVIAGTLGHLSFVRLQG